jgi:hypothetical protein
VKTHFRREPKKKRNSNGEMMIKVLTLLVVLSITAIGVSAQTPNKEAAVMKPVAYKTKASNHSKAGVVELGPRSTYLKEGLTLAAVLQAMGKPTSVTERTSNGKTVTSYEFSRGAGRTVIADFVDDVLIHSQTVTVDEIKPGVAG